MKPGKEPIRNKVYESLLETSALSKSKLALSEIQRDYVKQNGLEVRFIRKKEYLEANNFHRTGWKIVQDKDMPGSNAEGLIEIGDLVLAVKTKEAQRVHRAELKSKTERHTDQKRVMQEAAAKLRDSARAANLNAQIHEGYEENGGKDADE